jgi:hypothetical protein
MSAPAKYRKKPVVIEAIQYDRTNGGVIAKWCGGREQFEGKASDPTDVAEWIDIPTLEGVMKAQIGDFIIKGVNGEFYPCKPDIFAKTYAREDTEWPTAP